MTQVLAEPKELTEGGVEYAFEAVGLKKTAEQTFECLRPGGTATIIGMVPFGMKIELHAYDFLRETAWCMDRLMVLESPLA